MPIAYTPPVAVVVATAAAARWRCDLHAKTGLEANAGVSTGSCNQCACGRGPTRGRGRGAGIQGKILRHPRCSSKWRGSRRNLRDCHLGPAVVPHDNCHRDELARVRSRTLLEERRRTSPLLDAGILDGLDIGKGILDSLEQGRQGNTAPPNDRRLHPWSSCTTWGTAPVPCSRQRRRGVLTCRVCRTPSRRPSQADEVQLIRIFADEPGVAVGSGEGRDGVDRVRAGASR